MDIFLLQFLHASLFSPETSMILNAIAKSPISQHGRDSQQRPSDNTYQN